MDLPINAPPSATLKEKFEVKLAEYEQENQGSQRKPWTTERILEVINNVRKARVSLTSKEARTSMDYYWISKYDTMVIANEVFLIFKKKSPDDPTVRIIPRNEYFGTLEDIHKACGHGGRDKMLHAIKSRYYIPRKAIEIFLVLCPTCETKKTLPKNGIVTKTIVSQDFNIRGQIDLIDFQSCPDGEYKWLLYYQDNDTKFVSLRPLKTKRTQEVAMELMKIFMIFGAPYILQSDNGGEFTEKIIEELTSMWPECKIVHGSPKHPQTQSSVERSNQGVENMFRAWMNDNNSTNWSVGCHHVQYKKNASFHRIIGRSPYEALFGCNPKAGLNDSVIPFSILSNAETEEQLQNLSHCKGTKRAPEKIVNNTAKILPPLIVGDTVIICVPKVDRGPFDTQNIRGKIVDFQNRVYRVGTKSGTIKNWFARHEMQISSEDYNDDIPDIPISLREAASRESVFGGHGFQKCICKPAQKQCRTNRCACFKKKLLCGSKYHNSLSCVNK